MLGLGGRNELEGILVPGAKVPLVYEIPLIEHMPWHLALVVFCVQV